MLLLSYDTDVHRSDPNGMLIRFAAESPRPIVLIDLDLEEDGEPSIPIAFRNEVARDGRYVRALAFKPTRNGQWRLRVTATDDQGRTGTVTGPDLVTVSP